MTFRLEGLPPSFNNHFRINYNMRNIYLTQEARMFKTKVKMTMPPFAYRDTDLFKIRIIFHSNFFYKNNKPKRIDIQNLDKLLIDAIFDKIDADDSRLWSVELSKFQTLDKEYTEVILMRVEQNGTQG